MSGEELERRIKTVSDDMNAAARKTDFIEAARLRDELVSLIELQKQRN